ncbi:MAG: tryptophan-rich sensory protein [Actinomycetota bacterium]|nr:tryptophan-rich sensory protein [Actinomycetota bacterium]
MWVLIAFLGTSAFVLAVGAAALGPFFIGWYGEADRPAWELPLTVRGGVWYVQNALVATSAWLVWTYPRRGVRGRALALFAGNLVLTSIVRPLLLALYPVLGTPALWLSVVAVGVLLVLLTVVAVRLRGTHPLAAGLLVPCILWQLYLAALNVALASAN